MHQKGRFISPLFVCFLVMTCMLQGCSTHAYETTAHKLRVNQDQANAWRRHGDEEVAASFEERNRRIAEDEAGYGLADLLIDIVFSD